MSANSCHFLLSNASFLNKQLAKVRSQPELGGIMVQVLPGRSVHKRVQNRPGQFLEAVIELGKTRQGFDKGALFLLTEPTLALQLTGWPVLRGDPFPLHANCASRRGSGGRQTQILISD